MNYNKVSGIGLETEYVNLSEIEYSWLINNGLYNKDMTATSLLDKARGDVSTEPLELKMKAISEATQLKLPLMIEIIDALDNKVWINFDLTGLKGDNILNHDIEDQFFYINIDKGATQLVMSSTHPDVQLRALTLLLEGRINDKTYLEKSDSYFVLKDKIIEILKDVELLSIEDVIELIQYLTDKDIVCDSASELLQVISKTNSFTKATTSPITMVLIAVILFKLTGFKGELYNQYIELLKTHDDSLELYNSFVTYINNL